MNDAPHLDRVFSALADATRRAMIERLVLGEATVSELAAPFDLRQPTISKHLKVLEEAGLVTQSREARSRPRRIALGELAKIDAWLAPFRAQWEARLDNLVAHLERTKPIASKGPATPKSPSKKRNPRR
ncbi:MAG: metalloregulator ArsR/SmtB family transcription factor [Polyangiaceae bacterium]